VRARTLFRVLSLGLVLGTVSARADLVDSERIEAWERWREQPLDLRSAAEDEIALLPGADRSIARAVVNLRTARRDFDFADLDRLDGLDAVTLETWSELVELDAVSGFRWESTVETTRRRHAVRGRRGNWTVGGVRADAGGATRGWLTGRMVGTDVTVGALRFDFGSGLGVSDALGRSRLGAVRRPRTARVRGRTDASTTVGWRGVALGRRFAFGHVHTLVARDVADDLSCVLAFDRRDGRGGVVVHAAETGVRGATWIRRDLTAAVHLWAEGSAASTLDDAVTGVGLRSRGAAGEVDIAWVRADGARGGATDPITGSKIDRTHAAWQIDARTRQGPLRIEALFRHRERAEDVDERLRVDLAWTAARKHDGAPRWNARASVGVEEDVEADAVEPMLRTELRRSTDLARVVLAWARRGSAASGREALALRVLRRVEWGGFASIEAAVGHAARDASAPWFVSRPLAGIRPLWIPARGHAGWFAVAGGHGIVRWGAWAWWRGPVADGATGAGFALRLEQGDVVRRLHRGR